MQPYFFPYLGYFSLMAAVDVFVSYDNVQYTRPGWINRNRILRDTAPDWWTATLTDAPHERDINERVYREWPLQRQRLLDRLRDRYRRAPYYAEGIALIEAALPADEDNVARCNMRLLASLSDGLGLHCEVRAASTVPHDTSLRGEDRVLAICTSLAAKTYVNSPGGIGLYDAERFASHGLALRFVNAQADAYAQFDAIFVPGLSIVDALMFLPLAEVSRRVRQFVLVEATA